jgi:hypothetical protein
MFKVQEYLTKELVPFLTLKNANYLIRYVKFIEKFGNEAKTENSDRHHFLPRAHYKQYEFDENNLVYLTHKAHLFAHMMLVKIFDSPKMWCALKWMFELKNFTKNNVKLYELAKQKQAETVSKAFSESNTGMVPVIDLLTNTTTRITKEEYYSNYDRYDPTGFRKGVNSRTYKLTLEGKNPFVKFNKERKYEDHPAVIASREGRHWNNNCRPWYNGGATNVSLVTWWLVLELESITLRFPELGTYNKILDRCYEILEVNLSIQSYVVIMHKLRDGWWGYGRPENDPQWLEFKNNFIHPEGMVLHSPDYYASKINNLRNYVPISIDLTLPWNSIKNSTIMSKLTWFFADTIYEIYITIGNISITKFYRKCEELEIYSLLGIPLSYSVIIRMQNRFKNNWIPNNDQDWKYFKDNFKLV